MRVNFGPSIYTDQKYFNAGIKFNGNSGKSANNRIGTVINKLLSNTPNNYQTSFKMGREPKQSTVELRSAGGIIYIEIYDKHKTTALQLHPANTNSTATGMDKVKERIKEYEITDKNIGFLGVLCFTAWKTVRENLKINLPGNRQRSKSSINKNRR